MGQGVLGGRKPGKLPDEGGALKTKSILIPQLLITLLGAGFSIHKGQVKKLRPGLFFSLTFQQAGNW